VTPIPGVPGFAYKQSLGPDGNPTVEVVTVGGAQLPVDPADVPSDYTIGNTRYSGLDNQPLVTAPESVSPAQNETSRRFYLEWLDKHGMTGEDGKVVPLSAKEKLGMATHLLANPNDIDLPIFQSLVPLEKKQNQREFTWRDIMAEKARRRQADTLGIKSESDIDSEVAADFGMTVGELKDAMKQRSSDSGIPIVAPSMPPVPAGTQNLGPPAPQTDFDDWDAVPEGATVQEEDGKLVMKKNGKRVPVTGF